MNKPDIPMLIYFHRSLLATSTYLQPEILIRKLSKNLFAKLGKTFPTRRLYRYTHTHIEINQVKSAERILLLVINLPATRCNGWSFTARSKKYRGTRSLFARTRYTRVGEEEELSRRVWGSRSQWLRTNDGRCSAFFSFRFQIDRLSKR